MITIPHNMHTNSDSGCEHIVERGGQRGSGLIRGYINTRRPLTQVHYDAPAVCVGERIVQRDHRSRERGEIGLGRSCQHQQRVHESGNALELGRGRSREGEYGRRIDASSLAPRANYLEVDRDRIERILDLVRDPTSQPL
jgi:hypothetical protein